MALKTFVKVSTVNNLSDARYCAGMEVNLIGFNIQEGHPNYINPVTFGELTEWLAGVQYVGEFVRATAEDIKTTVTNYKLDYIEIDEPLLISELKDLDIPIILRMSIDELYDYANAKAKCAYLIVEGDSNELSYSDWELITSLAKNNKVLIGSGVNQNNVENLINETGAAGIALKGGDELRPGFKDYDELADILEALEINDLEAGS